MALLGELPLSSGNVLKQGKVVYASQEPWIFNGTIKYNITFGQEFDEERYNRVLKACALETVSSHWNWFYFTLFIFFFIPGGGYYFIKISKMKLGKKITNNYIFRNCGISVIKKVVGVGKGSVSKKSRTQF